MNEWKLIAYVIFIFACFAAIVLSTIFISEEHMKDKVRREVRSDISNAWKSLDRNHFTIAGIEVKDDKGNTEFFSTKEVLENIERVNEVLREKL